jgi:hypothetical protein
MHKFAALWLSFAAVAAADTALWEPAKVVSVEQISVPARDPDPSCHSVPKGENLPERCRPENLRAQTFWRVTVDVGNKRFVVRPYRTPKFLDSLNQSGTLYVDPKLTTASAVEVAVLSNKAIRLRTDQGQGTPALIDSQNLIAGAPAPAPRPKAAPVAVARISATAPTPSAPAPSGLAASKIVLLENSDFRDLEIQDFKSQDIGDGAVLYSFAGAASENQAASNPPVFLVLAENEAAAGGDVELSRLQVAKGTRQLVYSVSKKHSASSIPISVMQVSATVRKITLPAPLPPGEYVLLLENSAHGFLFGVH